MTQLSFFFGEFASEVRSLDAGQREKQYQRSSTFPLIRHITSKCLCGGAACSTRHQRTSASLIKTLLFIQAWLHIVKKKKLVEHKSTDRAPNSN